MRKWMCNFTQPTSLILNSNVKSRGTFCRWRFGDDRISKTACIYLLLLVGVISSILLVFLWDETAMISGGEYSVALFGLVFTLSLVDCSSSVLFLPFMAMFR